jgi:hypothetical protein
MCPDHCEAGAHHHHAPIKDWRRAWETSKVEPITLEPVDQLTITCLIDNVVDPLSQSSPSHGTACPWLLKDTPYKLSRSMFTSSANLALMACTLLFRRSASALGPAFTV